jgi:hypothetical protein
VWPFYYSKEDYERCCKVKAQVDPTGVFTANTFVVGYEPSRAPKHLALPDTQVNKPEEVLDDAKLTKGHAALAKQRAEAKGIHVEFR